MKRIYACLCIVAVLLGVAFYSSWRVQKFAEDISDDIDNDGGYPGQGPPFRAAGTGRGR